MPVYSPDFIDYKTGLRFSPPKGKIYDAALNIELNTHTGVVYDHETGKQYLLKDLFAHKGNQQIMRAIRMRADKGKPVNLQPATCN